MEVVEILHRFCRTHACVYVETGWKAGGAAYCFEDYEGRRFYLSTEEVQSSLAPASGEGVPR